jgi:hypothetical protein
LPLSLVFAFEQGLHLIHQIVDVLELMIHRREAYICDFIEPFELGHYLLAYPGALYLLYAEADKSLFDILDYGLELVRLDRSLLAGYMEALFYLFVVGTTSSTRS